MDAPTTTDRHRNHRIAAAFDTEADADAALMDLRPLAHEVHVDIHLAGCHDVDEAERSLGVTMVRAIAVTVPATIVLMLVLGILFRSALDLEAIDVVAVAVGAGGIFGILFGGIIGLALSARRLDGAHSPAVEHRAEEVLVAHVERGALHNPNHLRAEYQGMRTRAVVDDLEARVRDIFEAHHGHLIDA